MDPFRKPALQSAKLQSLLAPSSTNSSESHSSSDMPAPPAYHMVVEPNAPIPNMQNPYQHEEEEDKDDGDDTPEIVLNAATQVRGHGNVISIAQFDSARIAGLLGVLLNKGKLPDAASPPTPETGSASSTTEARPTRQSPRCSITVNCGATIIGDRNIVGPGLGDIAQQMQVAQRNQALLAQRQLQATADQKAQSPPQRREAIYQAQANIAQQHSAMYPMQGPTPPMSRTSSLSSDASIGLKRKVEHDVETREPKKQC